MIDDISIDRLDLRPKLLFAFVLVALLVAATAAVGYASASAQADGGYTPADRGDEFRFDR